MIAAIAMAAGVRADIWAIAGAQLEGFGRCAPPREWRECVGTVRLSSPDRVEPETFGLQDRVEGPLRRTRRPVSRVVTELDVSHGRTVRQCVAVGHAGGVVASDDRLVVTDSVRIPRHELAVTFSSSGGPGGQHANKAATRAELSFDVEASGAFTTPNASECSPSSARSSAWSPTTNALNCAIARWPRSVSPPSSAAHCTFLARGGRPSPTRGSQRRRVEAKKQRGETKRYRRPPSADD